MIYYFAARGYLAPASGLVDLKAPRVPVRRRSYDWLFRQRRLRLAAAIFTDLDRLSSDDHVRAEQIAAKFEKRGIRVFNRPARVKLRFELLRRLHDTGRNPFQVWRAEERPAVPADRFPVFVKSEGAHKRPVGGLIHDQASLDAVIGGLAHDGFPIRHFLVTEFCNAAMRDGVWARYTSYKIGERVFAGLPIFEDDPFVKYGTYGLAGEADFEHAVAVWQENRHAAALRRFFDIACIDYGRADYTVLDGRPVLYEINTNPTIPYEHVSRNDAYLAASRAVQRQVVTR